MRGQRASILLLTLAAAGCGAEPRDVAPAEKPASTARTASVESTPASGGQERSDRSSVPPVQRGSERQGAGSDRKARPAEEPLVVVTLTTTITEPAPRSADNGGSAALPMLPPGQRESVFSAPLAVSGLADPTVF